MENGIKMKPRFGLFLPFLLIALLISLGFPLAARADDATPTATGQSAITVAPPTITAPTPTPTGVPDDTQTSVAPTAAAPAATETPIATLADPAAAQPTSTPNRLQDDSSGATNPTPVVLDASGQPVALASNEAAQIIAAGDPIWCPIGHLPGDPQCTSAAPSITNLIASLGSMSGAGTIYFVSSGYSLPDATLNHSDPSLTNLTDLTIQGGWNGFSGSNFGLAGTTQFTVPLTINWVGNVTLNDLIFNSSGGDSLAVTTTGNITLENVEAKGNHLGRGARLDNTSGGTTVGVTIADSNFHNNQTGLAINTLGDISLASVAASYNDAAGVVASGRNVGVNGGDFTWNGTTGLVVSASQDVSLANVQASRNFGSGAVISGRNIWIDPGNFDHNNGTGLNLAASAAIGMSELSTSNNNAAGVVASAMQGITVYELTAVHNILGGTFWTPGNVSITSSVFGANTFDGADVQSTTGDITVDCTTFIDNGQYGLNATLPGILELKGDGFSGNGAGDYTVGGGGSVEVHRRYRCNVNNPTPTPAVPLPMNIVVVTEGQIVSLNCTTFIGTTLVLPNRDQVVFPCPILGDASLSSVGQDQLPGTLETGVTYVSGLKTTLVPTLTGTILVDFVMPQGQPNASYSVLRWDDTAWTDLHGLPTSDGYFEAHSTKNGVFVLVNK